MKYLNSWTLLYDTLPSYNSFKQPFCISADYNFFNRLYQSQLPELTDDRKALILPILQKIDQKTNKLTIRYNQRNGIGRFYPDNSISPICVSRFAKHSFFHQYDWIDLDMVKGHPTILYTIASKNGFHLPTFKNYIDNSLEIFNTLRTHYDSAELTNDHIKSLFNITIYGGTHSTWLSQMEKDGIPIGNAVPHRIYNEFFNECQKIMELIYISNPGLIEKVKGDLTNEYKIKCRTMSYFCGAIENEIIYIVYKLLEKKKLINNTNVCLEYDGLCFRPETKLTDCVLDSLLTEINTKIFKDTELNILMKWKPYDSIHVLTDRLFDEPYIPVANSDELVEIREFSEIAKEFEKTHCKIISKSVFVSHSDNHNVIMSRSQIKTSYENITYDKPVEKKSGNSVVTNYVSTNFINDWLVNNPSQRCYDDIGCYPPGITCPSNVFNCWTPFDMELVSQYESKPDEVQFLLDHIKILCGNDEPVYQYFIKWIAQMIQYPAIKTICPVMISKEGAGKSSFIRIMEKLLGSEKCFETTDPNRDVWGTFNSRMANSFLVNLNELSKKDTFESLGKIKGLITDNKIMINTKGCSSYEMFSPHRFIMTTNCEEPISVTKDNRRMFIFRCSDGLIGNKPYFKKLYEYINDMNIIASLYNYFKGIPEMDEFHKLQMPVTNYQSELQEMSVSPIEKWVESFVQTNSENESVEKPSKELFEEFCSWCSENNVEYHCSSVQFSVRLQRLGLPGIETKHTKKGNAKQFNITALKTHFGIGCLL